MRVLLDECLPRRLKRELPGHDVRTTPEMGWASKRNGELLRLAEREFDLFLTVDRKLPNQQNLAAFNIAVVVLLAPSNTLEDLEPLMAGVLETLAGAPGSLHSARVSPARSIPFARAWTRARSAHVAHSLSLVRTPACLAEARSAKAD